MSFHTFTLLILSPSHWGGEWARGCVVLSCRLGWNLDSQASAGLGILSNLRHESFIGLL